MTTRSRASAALCLACAAGCAERDDAITVSRVDSAGVEIVVTRGEDRALSWTFGRRMVIGGADEGPQSFYDLSRRHIATDGEGRLYVLDASALRVVAFDSEGSHLWSAGTEGQGPGEFSAPIAITATPNGLVSVVDATGMKVEHFDSAGRYLDGQRLESQPWMSQFGRSGAAWIVDERPVLLSDEARERLLLVEDADTTELASVELAAPRRLQFDGCPISITMPPIFGAGLWWASAPDMIAVAAGPEYVVDFFVNGRMTRSYRRDIKPRAATADLAAAEIPEGLSLGAGPVRCDIPAQEAVEKRGFGPFVPTVRGLAVAPDRTLWVQRTLARDGRAAFDILGPDGSYLGSVGDAPVPAAFMPDGRVIAIETDEFDIDRLVVYAVQTR